jgi:DAACS family dicarboxylate/amino acid:cation (Na+ or H+) symporter
MALHTRILLGLFAGVVFGLLGNYLLGSQNGMILWIIGNISEPLGQLFLRLLLMIVVPLVFSSLIVGVSEMGDIRMLGRVGMKSVIYTIVISAISVAIGIGVSKLINPGKRMSEETSSALIARFSFDAQNRVSKVASPTTDTPLLQAVKTLVPSNPFMAAASETPNMLHLMFFALMLAIAMMLIPANASAPVVTFFQSLNQICTKCVDMIMRLAPIAVFCLIFNNTALFGLDLLQALAWFVATVLLGLTLQMFGVYSLSVYFLSRMSPIEFFKKSKLAIITAFSTSSSNATLPTALKVSEENLKIPREINSFVLTVGATANQNGTALYEGVTILFLAQLSGIELTLTQQIMVAYMAIIGGIGTAGVPSGSIPFIIVVLATLGIDPSLIAIILGVDRILDMCRTSLNVTGDLTLATYIARSEQERLKKKALILQ